MKKKLIVSFSGGRTSAFMLWLIWSTWRDIYDILVVFANTGKEVEGTLEFVRDCAKHWGIPIAWVEYRPKPGTRGSASAPVVVDFETASRHGEPFEALIAVVGIPSTAAPLCSERLKRYTIQAYARSVWGERAKYWVAIGIRNDEVGRVNKKYEENRIVYPLIASDEWPGFGNFDKEDVAEFWQDQPFDLSIHPDEGNCDNCWKKILMR